MQVLKKIFVPILITLTVIVLLFGTVAWLVTNRLNFGKAPSGARLSRIEQSPNYKDGKFQNLTSTAMLASDKSMIILAAEFLFQEIKDLRPMKNIPSVKNDLKNLPPDQNLIVWLGHSSLYIQLDRKRILVDPVLVSASPFTFANKAFDGADVYQPDDMPDIDYLLITHDHWDHLDYDTMLKLKGRVSKIVCPLGVGSHLEHWGIAPEIISEHDWYDSLSLDEHIIVHTLPARHFSGRSFQKNNTLWASYMLQSSLGNMYISGDTGYESHFADIKKQFGTIHFAIMENGQYNQDWRYIHLMPEDLVKAVNDLQPDRFFTVHNSKYALGKHAWYEPLDQIYKASVKDSLPLLTPMIGELVILGDSVRQPAKWWKN